MKFLGSKVLAYAILGIFLGLTFAQELPSCAVNVSQ